MGGVSDDGTSEGNYGSDGEGMGGARPASGGLLLDAPVVCLVHRAVESFGVVILSNALRAYRHRA